MGCLDGFLGSNNKITHLLFALIASTCILHQHFPLFGLVSTNPFTQHWLTSKKQGLQPSFLELTSQPWTFLSALHKTKKQEQNQNNKNQTTQNRKSKIKETKNKHRADRKVHGPHPPPPPILLRSPIRQSRWWHNLLGIHRGEEAPNSTKQRGGTICWAIRGEEAPVRLRQTLDFLPCSMLCLEQPPQKRKPKKKQKQMKQQNKTSKKKKKSKKNQKSKIKNQTSKHTRHIQPELVGRPRSPLPPILPPALLPPILRSRFDKAAWWHNLLG